MSNNRKKYDLEERTAMFAKLVVDFAKLIPQVPVNNPLTT